MAAFLYQLRDADVNKRSLLLMIEGGHHPQSPDTGAPLVYVIDDARLPRCTRLEEVDRLYANTPSKATNKTNTQQRRSIASTGSRARSCRTTEEADNLRIHPDQATSRPSDRTFRLELSFRHFLRHTTRLHFRPSLPQQPTLGRLVMA